MSDPASTLESLAAKAGQLYSLPVVAMQVLELTNNPQVDARALKQCIENDPALTTKLLRVVNSSLFGLHCEVSDLNQALTLLGIKPLKLLVLGFSLPGELFAGMAGDVLGRYWRHTLTKAVAAREISESFWRQPGDEAFIAGLLQDLGMLLLIQELGEPYVRFLDKVAATGGNLAALETRSLGFEHTALTARLLAQWHLPDTLVEAVAPPTECPPAPGASPPARPLSQIVRLAELVARLVADEQTHVLGDLLALGETEDPFSQEQLEELIGNLEQTVGQLADVLSLQLPQGLQYRDVLVQAHLQLARVASETAEDMVRQQDRRPIPPCEGPELLDEIQSLSEAIAKVSGRAGEPVAPNRAKAAGPEPPAAESPRRATAGALAAVVAAAPHRHADARPFAVEPDPGLLAQLAAAVTACRQSDRAVSLLLVELDNLDDLITTYGVEGFEKLRRFLETVCRSLDHPGTTCLPHGEAGFAIILPRCDRQPTVNLGRHLIERIRRVTSGQSSGGRPAVSISIGAATVSQPLNKFPPRKLFDGANRCLYGSHASGGGVVKSIEIY